MLISSAIAVAVKIAAALVPLYLSAIFAASAMADEIDIRTFQVILSHEEPDR